MAYKVRYYYAGNVLTHDIDCGDIRQEGAYTIFLNPEEEIVAMIPTASILDIYEESVAPTA